MRVRCNFQFVTVEATTPDCAVPYFYDRRQRSAGLVDLLIWKILELDRVVGVHVLSAIFSSCMCVKNEHIAAAGGER